MDANGPVSVLRASPWHVRIWEEDPADSRTQRVNSRGSNYRIRKTTDCEQLDHNSLNTILLKFTKQNTCSVNQVLMDSSAHCF